MRALLTVAVFLALVNGAFMLFDGSRALLVGDYLTPRTGRHAGQLGPWSDLLGRLGVDGRATPVKCAFVILGLATVAGVVGYFANAGWARPVLVFAAIAGLWYLPFGTMINLLLLVALWLQR